MLNNFTLLLPDTTPNYTLWSGGLFFLAIALVYMGRKTWRSWSTMRRKASWLEEDFIP